MVDIQKLTQELMDSQRFSTLVQALGVGWKKRALTDEDRLRLLEPIVAMMMAKMDVAQAPAPRELKQNLQAAMAETQRLSNGASKPAVSMGDLDSSAAIEELGFDPFVQQTAKEPDPVEVRTQQLGAMRSLLTAANIPVGQEKNVVFPIDWNANDANVFFSALGGDYVLGSRGVQLALPTDAAGGLDTSGQGKLSQEGWKVHVVRQR